MGSFMPKHTILSKIILTALLIHAPCIFSYDYWRNLKNAPSTIWQWMNNNTKKTALGSTIALGTIALYLYNKYQNTPAYQLIQSGSSTLSYPYSAYRDPKFDPKQQEEPMAAAKQPLEELEKPVIVGDARISRFVNNWRDASDIRREFEDPENWPLVVSSELKKPDNPNVDVNVAEPSDVYDIRNILLPPKQLFDQRGTRRSDFYKYEVTRNKMTYVMRQNTGHRDFIGFITFYKRYQPSEQVWPLPPLEGYIEIMLISKRFRGKQYAAQLMNFVLDKIKDMGISRAVLYTGLDNKRSRAFYEKMGFTPTEELYDGNIMYTKYIGD